MRTLHLQKIALVIITGLSYLLPAGSWEMRLIWVEFLLPKLYKYLNSTMLFTKAVSSPRKHILDAIIFQYYLTLFYSYFMRELTHFFMYRKNFANRPSRISMVIYSTSLLGHYCLETHWFQIERICKCNVIFKKIQHSLGFLNTFYFTTGHWHNHSVFTVICLLSNKLWSAKQISLHWDETTYTVFLAIEVCILLARHM